MAGVAFKESDFGNLGAKLIKAFTWKNKNVSVQVITYGATITSIKIPDKNGVTVDIVTGFVNLDGKKQRKLIFSQN